MARELCEKTDWQDWLSVSVLGAAYSELNDFENALVYAQMALDLAPDDEKPERQKRIEQFTNKIPFRIPETNPATGKVIEATEED